MTKDFITAVVVVLIVFAVCFGAARIRPDLPLTPSTPFSSLPATKPGAPPAAANDKVVMRVNGEAVTEKEFNAFLQQAPEQMQSFYASPEGRRLLAEQLVKLKALEQEGRRLGVENDPEAASRISMARANIVAGFALQKMIQPPTDARLRAEWEKQKKNFETMQLSHILIAYAGGGVPPKQGTPPLTEADAMKKAQGIAARLRAGADFAQMARSESDDVQSASEGGRLGDVSPAGLPPEVQSVVSGLKDQQVSAPVKSQFGIHIFKAGAHTARRYEDLKPMFASKLQRDEAEATLSRLQKSAKVELDPQFFRETSTATPPRGRS